MDDKRKSRYRILKNIKMENVHSTIVYNDYDRINLNRFNLLGGIRFYFGDR